MKPSELLDANRGAIRRIVAAHRGLNPRVFGSVVQGNDTEDSDLDLLVDPTPDTSLLDIAKIQNRIQKLLGIPVDVLTPKGLPEQWRDKIISEAKLI